MKDKKDLMRRLSIAGCAFGYFCMVRFPIGFRLLFIVMALMAVIVYIVESFKNKYSKISIIVSVLTLFMFIILFIDEIIIYKYPQFLGYRGYIILLGTIIIVIMLIFSANNYIKTANKEAVLFTKVLSLLILIGLILVIILVALKKFGIIP